MSDTSDPNSTPPKIVSATKLYAEVPALRRQDVCSMLLVAHVAAMFIVGSVPILFPIGAITTLGVVLVCVMALSGPIYMKQLNVRTKQLEQWGTANKIAAVIILVLFIGGYGFLGYWLFLRN